MPETLLKKRLQYRCFSVNIAKFPRTLTLKTSANACFHIGSVQEVAAANLGPCKTSMMTIFCKNC